MIDSARFHVLAWQHAHASTDQGGAGFKKSQLELRDMLFECPYVLVECLRDPVYRVIGFLICIMTHRERRGVFHFHYHGRSFCCTPTEGEGGYLN